jgi:hypothetical protein
MSAAICLVCIHVEEAICLGDSELSSVGVPSCIPPATIFGGVSVGGGHVGIFEGEASTGGAVAGGDSGGARRAEAGTNGGGRGAAPSP